MNLLSFGLLSSFYFRNFQFLNIANLGFHIYRVCISMPERSGGGDGGLGQVVELPQIFSKSGYYGAFFKNGLQHFVKIADTTLFKFDTS